MPISEGFIHMLRSLCRSVYNTKAPTPAYADRAAQLLYMIMLHESDGGVARRQYKFSPVTHEGAFSLYQMEIAGIRDSMADLRNKPALLHHVREWMESSGWSMFPIVDEEIDELLLLIQRPEGDVVASVLARLYLFRIAEPIPDNGRLMADYAKRWWNRGGKATPLKYAGAAYDGLWQLLAL